MNQSAVIASANTAGRTDGRMDRQRGEESVHLVCVHMQCLLRRDRRLIEYRAKWVSVGAKGVCVCRGLLC